MSEKIDLSTENNAPHGAIDSHLYPRVEKIFAIQAYEYLNDNAAHMSEQKRQFIEGETRNPNIDYPDLNLARFNELDDELQNIKTDLIQNEDNEVLKQTYRWRINEKLAEIRMLKAAATGDMRRFKKYTEFIYGKPSNDVFAYTISSIARQAMDSLDSGKAELTNAARDLLDILPTVDQPVFIDLPDAQNLSYIHEQTTSELGGLINIPEQTSKFDAEQIKGVFDAAINKVGGSNWTVVIDAGTTSAAVSVNHESKEVVVPQNREVARAKLVGLVVHEIGTHVLRRVNGERSRLMLLGTGLDRYDLGEEGITTVREQAIANKMEDFKGIDGLLSVGLALGLDGKARDFRDVYEILQKYYFFKKIAKVGPDEAKAYSQDTAWRRCIRTFRGTDCATPGTCFTKDIIYRQGNIGVWDLIKKNPEEALRFNIGKFDPTNERHIWILEQLGVSDQDLSSLES